MVDYIFYVFSDMSCDLICESDISPVTVCHLTNCEIYYVFNIVPVFNDTSKGWKD